MREAEVSVTDAEIEAMGLAGLLSLARSAGLRSVEELACHGTGAVLQVAVESRMDGAALDALDCTDRWTHVADRRDDHLYVLAITAPELPESLAETAADLVGTCDPDLDDDGATLSLVGPHGAISDQLSEYEAAGVSPALRRIGRYRGPEHPLESLTDRQREVLEAAWDLGYFEVPKAAGAEDVASELDLDPSTVNEHLQRAERNLLGRLL